MPRPLGALDRSKRAAIIAGARHAFREHGFGASMDEIALRSGVSKQTIYNHFGSKTELVHALADETCGLLFAALAQAGRHDDPAETLTAFAASFLTQILKPDMLAMHRVVIGGATTFPELTREVFRNGPGDGRRRLADYLAEVTRQGRLAVTNTDLAAEIFLGMLLGQQHLSALLQVPERPDEAEISHRVRECVRVFMAAYGAPADAKPRPDQGQPATAALTNGQTSAPPR